MQTIFAFAKLSSRVKRKHPQALLLSSLSILLATTVSLQSFVISTSCPGKVLADGPQNEEEAKSQPRIHDLEGAYATSGQNGLKLITAADGKFARDLLSNHLAGYSNIFLVRGKDINAALRATCSTCLSGKTADLISLSDQQHSRTWIVVHLGVGPSAPPRWRLHSVERTAATITVSYENGVGKTADAIPYIFWIPIDDLDAGKYHLKLVSRDEREETLSRLCKIVK